MVKASEIEGVTVPEATIDALNRTLCSVERLEAQLPQFLSLSDPEILSQMPLLERAHSLFTLAKLTNTLFSLKLKCRGVNPNDHPFKSELDRLRLCQKRMERLPSLSEAERQDMRNYPEQAGQKRKYPSSEEQSVQTDSKKFMEIAAGELVGGNSGSTKEVIVVDISDDDDDDNDELLAP